MIVPLGFLILGGGFVYSLVTALIKLLNIDWKDDKAKSKIKSTIAVPLIWCILLIIFMVFGLPYFEANGIK